MNGKHNFPKDINLAFEKMEEGINTERLLLILRNFN